MIAAIFIITSLYFVMVGVRIFMVHRYIGRRIEEKFASKFWYRTSIDMDAAYKDVWFSFKKWSYRDFFPEEIV